MTTMKTDYLACIAQNDLYNIGDQLAASAFMHGRCITSREDGVIAPMYAFLSISNSITFAGVRITTCANRRPIISTSQYGL